MRLHPEHALALHRAEVQRRERDRDRVRAATSRMQGNDRPARATDRDDG
jgi:hypothetical protein